MAAAREIYRQLSSRLVPATPAAYSAIVVTWRDRDVVAACIDSLLAQDVDGELEVIVVDNASGDGTREILRGYEPRIQVIDAGGNLGYSGGNNLGAERATGDVLFLLNSDTVLVAPDTLRTLAGALDDATVGLAGPKLVNPDGTLQPSADAHPSVARALLVATGVHRLLPDRWRAFAYPARWSHDHSRDTDWVMGAALCIRADLFRELGGFPERPYGQEQDLASAVQQRGLRVRFVSEAEVMHHANHSGSQRFSDVERARLIAQSELAFTVRHCGPIRAAAIRIITGAGLGARVVLWQVLGQGARSRRLAEMARVYARGPSALPSGGG
jgi:GT2 family glycosyltransferase